MNNTPRPHVFVELLDQENALLFRLGEENVMVSPMVVSYIVSQVALRPELARVFWELTRPWGAQIMLRPVDRYFDPTKPLRFREVEQAAAAHGEIALGFRRSAPGADGDVCST